MRLNDDWWYGFVIAWVLVGVIVLGVSLFNVHRPRVMAYTTQHQQCEVMDGTVVACWPDPQNK